MIELLPFFAIVGIFANLSISFGKNIIAAHGSGLPYILVIGHEENPLAYFLGLFLRHMDWMPEGRIKVILRHWAWEDKNSFHAKYGEVFIAVSPFRNVLYVANPDVIHQVYTRRQDFPKQITREKYIELFGPNVATTVGSVWRRHRKIVSLAFNETTYRLVAQEAGYQTKLLLSHWGALENSVVTVSHTAEIFHTLALHVFVGSGFGIPLGWSTPPPKELQRDNIASEGIVGNHRLSFRQSIQMVVENLRLLLIVPHWLLRWAGASSKVQACDELGTYMREFLEAERSNLDGKARFTGNILSNLLQHSQTVDKDQELSDAEVIANTFASLLGGHETTASTLNYALLLLAINPDIQEACRANVLSCYMKIKENGRTSLSYPDDWNDLQYILALMHETLRLYPPGSIIGRSTGSQYQPIQFNGKTHTLSPDTYVFLNVSAVHYQPQVWGPDVLEFKPERWIQRFETGEKSSVKLPANGTYFPFSRGARICIGEKFSQVEFVTVISTLLSTHRIELGPNVTVGDVTHALSRRAGALAAQAKGDIKLRMVKL